MKRDRKVWYTIRVPGLWWAGKKKGWVDTSTSESIPCSLSRMILNADKTFTEAAKLPVGVIVTRFFYKKGVLWTQTWESVLPLKDKKI